MSHYKGPDINVAYPNFRPSSSVLSLLEKALRGNRHATAMVEGQTGRTASFHDILQHSRSIAAGLRSAGVTAGDYVVICGDKTIVAYYVLLGTMFTGATAVMFPVPHADIMHKLTQGFRVKAVFCDVELLDTLRTSMRNMTSQPVLVGTLDIEDNVIADLMKNTPSFEIYPVEDVKTHIPLIFFSSGTTGEPKGIQLTDVYVQNAGLSINFNCKTVLTASPMYWLSGLLFFVSSAFYNYKVVMSNTSRPSDNLQLIQRYQVDGWFTGTGSLSRYINEPTLHQYDLTSLTRVYSGGECIPSSTAEAFTSKVLGNRVNLHTLYGNTEGSMLTFQELQRKNGLIETGACGKVMPGVEVKILDDGGNLVPVGTLGHIWCRSPYMSIGYWGRPDLNEKAFNMDGFFHTGDGGFFDIEGNLYLRGRVEDFINFRGTKVSPLEVEDILMSHEAVLDAAVVGKDHPTEGQHLIAFVVPTLGHAVTEPELERFVDDKVEDSLTLRGGLYFMDALPRTIIGKVQRKRLREISHTL